MSIIEDSQSESTYVQESLFDVGPDEEVGYRVPIACQVAGITYRQLDYWARTNLVNPSIRTARGSGSQRLYSFKDVLVLKIVKRLLDTGISLQNIRLAVESLRDRGVNDLAELTLVSDGTTVYECRSNRLACRWPGRLWYCSSWYFEGTVRHHFFFPFGTHRRLRRGQRRRARRACCPSQAQELLGFDHKNPPYFPAHGEIGWIFDL